MARSNQSEVTPGTWEDAVRPSNRVDVPLGTF